MLFQFVQILYWLALATWFGGVMFIAVAAPVIFRVVRRNNPVLPNVLSANLEGQHSTLLAGSIVGALLARLAQIQLICGTVMLVALIGQLQLADMTGDNLKAAILRVFLYAAAILVVLYDWRVRWPQI